MQRRACGGQGERLLPIERCAHDLNLGGALQQRLKCEDHDSGAAGIQGALQRFTQLGGRQGGRAVHRLDDGQYGSLRPRLHILHHLGDPGDGPCAELVIDHGADHVDGLGQQRQVLAGHAADGAGIVVAPPRQREETQLYG